MSSIVVVGGGLAGLVCALRLQRAGHEVEVLEAGEAAGGRAGSRWQGGFRLDPGPARIAGGDANLRGLCGALGLEARLQPASRREAAASGPEAVLRGSRLDPIGSLRLAATTAPGLSARARAGLLRVGLELLRHGRRLDPHHPEAAALLDAEALGPGLRRLAGDEAFDGLLAPWLATRWGVDPEVLSLAAGLLSLRRELAGGEARLDGGLGALVIALAARVPVRVGCEVEGVETETDGARVRYRRQGRRRTVLADAAVIATPAGLVPRLCPKLTPAERGFFEALQPAPGTVAYLLLDEPAVLSGFQEVVFRPLDAGALSSVSLRPGAAPEGRGLLTATLGEAATHRLWSADDAEVERAVLDALAGTPLARPHPARCVVRRWEAAGPVFARGVLRRLRGFLARVDRSPRLAFAGDYLVGPHAEGAVTSGMRAAAEISRALA